MPRTAESSNLDLLRSAAVLFVVVSHLPLVLDTFGGHFAVMALGHLGVAVFFVHTCLVLMLSLERQTAELGERRRAAVFFVRRALRIYPLSVAVVLIAYGVYQLLNWPVSPGLLVANLLLVQSFLGHEASLVAPLWSLPFEVQMYLALPLLYVVVTRARRPAVTIALLWVTSALVVTVLWRLGLRVEFLTYLPCFLPGILAYALWPARPRISPTCLAAWVGAAGVAVPWVAHAHGRANVLSWPVCLGLGLLIPFSREIAPGLLARASKVIARYSYGIYLVHYPCVRLAFDVLQGWPIAARWAVFLASTVVLSFLAYHLVEKPGIRLGRRLGARVSAPRGDVAASSPA